jgi:glycosyltransferase involved in cell wall biosynthesis
MKVCILAPENSPSWGENSPSWGGVGAYVYNLVKYLPNNFDKHIITINRNVSDSYDKLLKGENCHIHNILDVKKNDSFFYNLRFQLAVLKKLRGLHKKYNFDIIHSHSGHLPHLFSQFLGIAPQVVTVHSTSRGMNLNLKQFKSERSETEIYMDLFSKYIGFCEKISFKKSDKLLPISKFTLEEITKLYNIDIVRKSVVIPNATDIDMFKPEKLEYSNKNVITFIGRFYAIKGFNTYLKALVNIKKKGYEVKPYLVGRGNTELIYEYLKSNFSQYVLQDLAPYQEMPKIYINSGIVIVPSLYENCPSVVLEAMSSGKIVIASNVGGIPDIIENEKNGFLFEKGNSVELEKKIISILENTYDLDKIRTNARNSIILDYQWGERAREISREYKNVIK